MFKRDLDLPDSRERELVHERDRDYTLNGSDTRTLSTIGAFRVVSERDVRDPRDAAFDDRADLRHLEKQGLIERVPLDGRDRAVVLTDRGRSLLEAHRRDRNPEHRQAFYAGADRARERTHDAQLYRAYLKQAGRLRNEDARIVRVQLDRELKREYQRFLQDRNRGDRDSDGRPDRSPDEIEEWAREHDLPYYDDQVHFPDVRIEYEDVDGDVHNRDVEVTTEHYRGGHARSVGRSGFAVYQSTGAAGVRLTRTSHRTSKTEAETVLGQFREAVRNGTFSANGPAEPEKPLMFAKFAAIYVERYVKANGLASYDTIEYRMAPILEHFGVKLLAEIRTADVEDFIAKLKEPATLAKHHQTVKTRRPATINRYLSLVRVPSKGIPKTTPNCWKPW